MDEILSFKRYEQKYLISQDQYLKLKAFLADDLKDDQYQNMHISNIYFDTPSFLLIRNSLEHPIYKEKLRIRTYEQFVNQDKVYVEIKKKYNDVTYKRRFSSTYLKAKDFVLSPKPFSQISREVTYFLKLYYPLNPVLYLTYTRLAYYLKDDKNLRITFDKDIFYQRCDNSYHPLNKPVSLIDDNNYLMEIKSSGYLPKKLSDALNDLNIYKCSFSKYGKAYLDYFKKEGLKNE